jgi:acetyltransferase
MQPNPKGSNLTIITNAGGPGIMATDSLIARGGKLSRLGSETIQALEGFLPSYCSSTNPIDIMEDATPDRFGKVMETCFKDANSDGYLIIYTPQGAADPVATARVIVELSKQTTKPILTCLMGEDGCRMARRILQKNGIPAFATPEQGVSTFMYMYSYTQNLELLYETPEELSVEVSIPTFLKEVLRRAVKEGRAVLTQPESWQFLEAYKIPTVRTVVAKTSVEAEKVASELGYPVVMKALSPQITHKSKAEGVILNVWSSAEVKTFFNELSERIRIYNPGAEFQGVVIQPMIQKGGYELLVGSKRDPQFGSVIAVGTGGIATELLKDASVGFPPLNQILARRLVERTQIFKRSESSGYPLNLKLIEGVLVKFSQLVIDFPEIREIDINPLIVERNEAVAVDARIVIDTEKMSAEVQPHEHLVIMPYPKKYVSEWKLKDGTSVALRPIKPEDETLFYELFKSLSEETMRFRFFQIIKDLPHETLTRYCNLDYDREIAIVAEAQKDKRRIIGVGRLILEPGRKNGEFAVVVGDEWQGLGLGSKLIDSIIQIGRDMNLTSIFGYVISMNVKMLHICTAKGFKTEQIDEEVTKVTLDLS